MAKRNRSKPKLPVEGPITVTEDTEATSELAQEFQRGREKGWDEGLREGRKQAFRDEQRILEARRLDVLHNAAQAFIELANCPPIRSSQSYPKAEDTTAMSPVERR